MRNSFLVAALGLCQLYILRTASAKTVSCEKWKYTYFKKEFLLSSSFHSQWVFNKFLAASEKGPEWTVKKIVKIPKKLGSQPMRVLQSIVLTRNSKKKKEE